MKSATSIIAKLRKPPAVHNWVKNVRLRRDETAFALHNFALNPPRSSLAKATEICAQIVVDQISLEQALKCASNIKDPSARERASWIARAFYAEAKRSGWEGIQVFRDMVEYYPVAAGVRVPVRPTFVVNEDGKLIPYFLICWSKFDLSYYQRRILSTLISEAILSLEEFDGSDAMIVCTPLAPWSKKDRQVITWSASAFAALDDDEKQALFDRYAGALNDAEKMIIESLR